MRIATVVCAPSSLTCRTKEWKTSRNWKASRNWTVFCSKDSMYTSDIILDALYEMDLHEWRRL